MIAFLPVITAGLLTGLSLILAVELTAAARAVELRAPHKPSPVSAELIARLRKVVPGMGTDRFLAPELAAAAELLRS